MEYTDTYTLRQIIWIENITGQDGGWVKILISRHNVANQNCSLTILEILHCHVKGYFVFFVVVISVMAVLYGHIGCGHLCPGCLCYDGLRCCCCYFHPYHHHHYLSIPKERLDDFDIPQEMWNGWNKDTH